MMKLLSSSCSYKLSLKNIRERHLQSDQIFYAHNICFRKRDITIFIFVIFQVKNNLINVILKKWPGPMFHSKGNSFRGKNFLFLCNRKKKLKTKTSRLIYKIMSIILQCQFNVNILLNNLSIYQSVLGHATNIFHRKSKLLKFIENVTLI